MQTFQTLDPELLARETISDLQVGACECCAGDLRGQGLGMHTASNSSLQHEEGVNGVGALPHPAHVRTASLADSGDEAAHAAGVILWLSFMHHMHLFVTTQQMGNMAMTWL